MDPTTREIIRGFLDEPEVLERLRGDEDELEALLDLAPVPDLAPHVVHVKPTFEEEDTSYYDDPPKMEPDPDRPGEERPVLHPRKRKVRRQVVIACPDCGRLLTSRGHDMVCPRLPMTIDLSGDHEGCVVACGAD